MSRARNKTIIGLLAPVLYLQITIATAVIEAKRYHQSDIILATTCGIAWPVYWSFRFWDALISRAES